MTAASSTLTPFVQGLACTQCGSFYPADELHTVCTKDGRPLEIRYNLRALERDLPGNAWLDPGRTDMWRYGALLPVAPPAGIPGAGWTPMDERPHSGLAGALYLKDEGRPRAGWGHNASGSFKDRGMAMVVAMARHFGLRQLMVPTQGNAGDSLATFGPALGISVAVSMPRDTPAPILDRVAGLAREDDRVRLFLSDGTIREAGALLKEKMAGEKAFSAATFAEPGWRIEGKKTLGLEIAEQLGWTLPEVVVYPTGGGTGILGMWKAFQELRQLGLVRGNMPRMISVQSQGTTPLVTAMESGASDCDVVPAGSTLAVGLNVPYGIGHFRVLEILRESGGAALAVDEDVIVAMSRELESEGIGPEGAACLAALPELERRGLILEGDRVVVVNTCSPEKYA